MLSISGVLCLSFYLSTFLAPKDMAKKQNFAVKDQR